MKKIKMVVNLNELSNKFVKVHTGKSQTLKVKKEGNKIIIKG